MTVAHHLQMSYSGVARDASGATHGAESRPDGFTLVQSILTLDD
jgi:hypothetical protein